MLFIDIIYKQQYRITSFVRHTATRLYRYIFLTVFMNLSAAGRLGYAAS